jgi:hypothetical protein
MPFHAHRQPSRGGPFSRHPARHPTPIDTPQGTPPARLEDVSGTLAELLTMAKEEREARQAQAERISRLEQAQQQPVEATPHGGVPEATEQEARRLRIALRRKGRRR